MSNVAPTVGPFILPQGHNLNKLGKVPHTKYQGCRTCGFRKDFFFHVFPLKAYI